MHRNYFADLELPPNSTPEQIKAAHRRLVRKYHPDFHKGDHSAAASFRRVQEAFEALSENINPPASRKKITYAQKRAYEKHKALEPFRPTRPTLRPIDLLVKVPLKKRTLLRGRYQKIVYLYRQGSDLLRQYVRLKIPRKLDIKKFYSLQQLGHYSADGKKRGTLWIQFEPEKVA